MSDDEEVESNIDSVEQDVGDFLKRALEIQETLDALTTNRAITSNLGARLRKTGSNFVRLVAAQQRYIVRLQTQVEERTKQLEERTSRRTYTEVVKTRPRSRSRSKSRSKQPHVLTVYPKTGGVDSESLKKRIQENINPAELKINVTKVRNIAKNGVLIEAERQEDIVKLKQNLEDNRTLKDEVECQFPNRRQPEVIVFNVDSGTTDEEVTEAFRSQFEAGLEEVSVKRKFDSKGGRNWILSVRGKVFGRAIRSKKLYLGWRRYNFAEHLRPLQCYKCGLFGHIANNCRGEEKCRKCGGSNHQSGDCSATEHCMNCEKHNSKFKTSYSCNHSCFDRECSIREIEINRIIVRTDYELDDEE